VYRDDERRVAGGIVIWFRSNSVMYKLLNCQGYDDQSGYNPFPPTLPTQLEKQWTIEKRGYKTRVFCNKVLVADITVSNVMCHKSDWGTYWSREVSGIEFSKWDDASDAYHIGQLSQLV
jgi:hypothetical protein